MNLHAIPKGRDRATPIGELAEALRVSRRRLERDLEALVLSGVPIVASSAGVYRSDSAEEVHAYVISLKGRQAAVAARIKALERAAERMEHTEQQSLGLVA